MNSGYLSHPRVERVIAGVRVLLAASSLFGIWLDPAEPATHVELTYTLHASYVAYAVLLAAIMWRRDSSGRLPLATHMTDIVMASVFQYLTLGPSSPFFLYFTFSLFSAALRWGWRQTIWTAAVELAAFVAMTAWLHRTVDPAVFDMNRFVIRFVYLIVVAGLLAYLGQHEARLREDIRRLAQWPMNTGETAEVFVQRVLRHAADILGAEHVTVVWSADDEPWMYVATSQSAQQGALIQRYAPADLEPLVPESLISAAFFSFEAVSDTAGLIVSRAGTLKPETGSPAHSRLHPLLAGIGLASAPFGTESLSGRVFCTGLTSLNPSIVPLTEVVARDIGTSLDHLDSTERSRQLAIVEDRIHVARNLHDGVLQSLTGIRFELQAIATAEQDAQTPVMVADRLLAIERALAIEQRELRRFTEGLKPGSGTLADASFAGRIEQFRQRMSAEWATPVTVRTHLGDTRMPRAIEEAVLFMVQEATVNALKHGSPSRVSIDLGLAGGVLSLTVTDDGRGFAFAGRHDHQTLAAANLGPVSLRERAGALGGTLAIESGLKGARVEIVVPVGATRG